MDQGPRNYMGTNHIRLSLNPEDPRFDLPLKAAENWLQTIEKRMDNMQMEDQLKIGICLFNLRHLPNYAVPKHGQFNTFDEFKAWFRECIQRQDAEMSFSEQLHNTRQTGSFRDYCLAFKKLRKDNQKLDFLCSEQELNSYFLQNLSNPDLRKYLQQSGHNLFQDYVRLAEQLFKDRVVTEDEFSLPFAVPTGPSGERKDADVPPEEDKTPKDENPKDENGDDFIPGPPSYMSDEEQAGHHSEPEAEVEPYDPTVEPLMGMQEESRLPIGLGYSESRQEDDSSEDDSPPPPPPPPVHHPVAEAYESYSFYKEPIEVTDNRIVIRPQRYEEPRAGEDGWKYRFTLGDSECPLDTSSKDKMLLEESAKTWLGAIEHRLNTLDFRSQEEQISFCLHNLSGFVKKAVNLQPPFKSYPQFKHWFSKFFDLMYEKRDVVTDLLETIQVGSIERFKLQFQNIHDENEFCKFPVSPQLIKEFFIRNLANGYLKSRIQEGKYFGLLEVFSQIDIILSLGEVPPAIPSKSATNAVVSARSGSPTNSVSSTKSNSPTNSGTSTKSISSNAVVPTNAIVPRNLAVPANPSAPTNIVVPPNAIAGSRIIPLKRKGASERKSTLKKPRDATSERKLPRPPSNREMSSEPSEASAAHSAPSTHSTPVTNAHTASAAPVASATSAASAKSAKSAKSATSAVSAVSAAPEAPEAPEAPAAPVAPAAPAAPNAPAALVGHSVHLTPAEHVSFAGHASPAIPTRPMFNDAVSFSPPQFVEKPPRSLDERIHGGRPSPRAFARSRGSSRGSDDELFGHRMEAKRVQFGHFNNHPHGR